MFRRTILGWERFKAGHLAKGRSYHRYFFNAFVVSEQRLRGIVETMTQDIGAATKDMGQRFTISAWTRQAKLEFKTLSELCSYFNAWRSRLFSVQLCVRAED